MTTTTTTNLSKHIRPMLAPPRTRWSKSKQSYSRRSQNFRIRGHFRSCGDRKDPLNLNELIRKKNQSVTTNEHTDGNIYGNDRPIELLLQPNIFDPLCLDISSYKKNENSISFNSTNQQTYLQKPFQLTTHNWFYDQHVPEQK